jgi:hypothetical protein
MTFDKTALNSQFHVSTESSIFTLENNVQHQRPRL